jgi:hypothetical protein
MVPSYISKCSGGLPLASENTIAMVTFRSACPNYAWPIHSLDSSTSEIAAMNQCNNQLEPLAATLLSSSEAGSFVSEPGSFGHKYAK